MHGRRDPLIPFSHSVELHKHCPTLACLNLVEEMDHNNFSMEDLVVPFKKFVEDVDKC